MRMLVKKACLMAVVLISLQGISQQLIQATLKLNSNPDEVEVWLKPNFNNSTQYLAQIAVPIAWPSGSPAVQPADITVTLDPTFVSTFGSNYAIEKYPLANNTCNTENYRVITMIRGGTGASNPQSWSSGQEFKLLTVKFPAGTPNGKVKIADYALDGGSDGQGYYYTADGNANYYTSSTSANNFYSTSGQSTMQSGGCAGSGFVETNVEIPAACPIPSVSTTNIGTTSAEINWLTITGASGYEYAITSSSTPPASGTPTNTTTFSPSGLTAATQYHVHVRTNCGGSSFSNWSSTSFTTAAVACTTPNVPTVNSVGITSADISWNAVSGATGYEYFLSTSATTPGNAPGTGTTTSSTNYPASGLTGGTTYYIFVRTNCGSGNYSPWVSTNFATQPPLCSPISTPVPGVITATTAAISWAAVSGSAGYEYVVSTSSTEPISPGTATVDPNFIQTNLTPGTAYYVFIRNNCGGGLFSNWISAQFNTLCPEPGSVAVGSIGSSSATITWNLTGATSYQVDISTSSTPTTVTPSTGGIIVQGNSYNATDLASGIAHYAHVRSICSTNNFSEWINIPFNTVCPQPTTAIITGISPSTPTAANITWPNIPDVNGYQYWISTSDSPPQSGTSIASTNVIPGNLTQGTQYYLHVRTECAPGIYSLWTTTSFTTVFPPCNPAGPLTINYTGSTVTFSWPPLSGVLGYEYAVTTGASSPTNWVFVSGTSGQMSDLSSNTQYFVYLRAKCGEGRFSNLISKSFITSCFKPSVFIKGNDIVAGTADLGWLSIKGALKYEYAILRTAAPPSGSVNFSIDTFLRASNLKPGTKYYLHVRTHCSASNISEWSTLVFYTSGIATSPNPVNEIVKITIFGESIRNGEVLLFDASGKKVQQVKVTSNTAEVSMRGLASGVYILKYILNAKYVVRILKL
jgi:hypothetical protein